jgi:ketosteroid isomerase-like protein
MKSLLSFFLLISFLNLSAQENDKKAIQNTIVNLFEQFSNRDLEKLKSYCTDDIQILENGEIWNLDTLAKKITQNKALDFKRMNNIDFLNVYTENKVGWTTYNNRADVIKDGQHYKIHWLETAILEKQKKTWKVKVLQSTLIKREKI